MEQLVESVVNYVKKENTDYAIMINGAWGSGKTYFWNNVLSNKLAEIKLNGEDIKIVYVSLYGVSNLNEISNNIFVQALANKNESIKKFANSKVGNTIPQVAKIILNVANLKGLALGENEIDFSKFCSFKNTVLCFDDLERADLDVSVILGYINNFVEHDRIKTIIIANEEEVRKKISMEKYELKILSAIKTLEQSGEFKADKDVKSSSKKERPTEVQDKIAETIDKIYGKNNTYDRIKEKLIGKTLFFNPEPDYMVEGIIEEYKDCVKLYEILKEQQQIIARLYTISQTKSLRILKQALNDYSDLFELLISNYPNIDHNIKLGLLLFTLAISFEVKSGNMQVSDFEKINCDTDYQSLLVMSAISGDTVIADFRNKYSLPSYSVTYYKFAEIYVRTGLFVKDKFKEEIDKMIDSSKDTTRLSDIVLYYDYYNLSDDEFSDALRQTLDTLKNGEIHFVNYYRAYIIFWHFSNDGLLSEDMKNYADVIQQGLELSKDKNTAYEDNIHFKLDRPKDEVLNKDTILNKIFERIIQINEELKSSEKSEQATELEKLLPGNMEEFYDRINKNYFFIPIFSYFDTSILFSKLKESNNSDLVFFKKIIYDRYKQGQNDLLKDEYKNLDELKKMIINDTKNSENKLSTYLLKELVEALDFACEKLSVYHNIADTEIKE
jgi:hypothetical protein